jgi:hypothetical protein
VSVAGAAAQGSVAVRSVATGRAGPTSVCGPAPLTNCRRVADEGGQAAGEDGLVSGGGSVSADKLRASDNSSRRGPSVDPSDGGGAALLVHGQSPARASGRHEKRGVSVLRRSGDGLRWSSQVVVEVPERDVTLCVRSGTAGDWIGRSAVEGGPGNRGWAGWDASGGGVGA